MFERPPRVHRFDEALEAAELVSSQIDRRSSRYVVGDANDSAERRADEVADRGLAILHGEHARLPASASTAGGPDSRIKRSANVSAIGLSDGPLDESTANELDSAIGHGRRFEPAVQRSVRQATGHDVGDVHVHTDGRADRLARSVQASAFTVDRNVFFARGHYRPDTDNGMHTVLHESAHLAERGTRAQRQTIRRRISTTSTDLDGSFKHETGIRGIAKAMSSDEIPKIRNALKRYHATKPGSPREVEELQILLKLGDEWLRKHYTVQDRADRSRMELIDSIRTQAGMELGKLMAASIYMNAGAAAGRAKQQPNSTPGPEALTALRHDKAFVDPALYEKRASVVDATGEKWATMGVDAEGYDIPTFGAQATIARDNLVQAGELAAHDPETEAALTRAIESLTPAEFAAIHTYTGDDYSYINPNVGGWGKGKMNAPVDMKMPNKKGALLSGKAGQTVSYSKDNHDPNNPDQKKNHDSYTDAATAKKNRNTYEEAGLHGGFMAEAFKKLPLWKGTTYKGMTMSVDYLGVTTKSSYTANDFWSTSEALSIAQHFLPISAGNNSPTMAAICTVNVTDGRDVSRVSNSPAELEILLAPGSTFHIVNKWRFEWGKDDQEIYRLFGSHAVDHQSMWGVKEFWWIELRQESRPKR